MASYKFEKAIVVGVGPTIDVTASFKKRELVISIDNDGQYPQKISIEAVQDKCNDQNLNEVRPGDEVSVDVNFRGNEWFDQKNNVTKYFNQLVYWKMSINRTSAGNNTQQNQPNFIPQGQQGFPHGQQAYGQPQQQQFGNPPAQQQQQFGQPNQFQQGPPQQQAQFGQQPAPVAPPAPVWDPQSGQWIMPPINDLPF